MEISNNSILLINNHFYKIFKKIIDKKEKNESTSSEIELINSQLLSENRKIVESAVNVLIYISKINNDNGFALNALISAITRLKNDNFDLLADGVFQILIENIEQYLNFQILERSHPALLFIDETNPTKLVYLSNKINEIFNSSQRNVRENAAKFFRPVLLTFLSSETIYSESRNVWNTIIEHENEDPMKIISLRRVTSPSSSIQFNSMIIATFKKHKSIDNMLLLISSTKFLTNHSLDITQNIDLMRNNLSVFENNPNSLNVALFLLAEILQNTSIRYVLNVVQLIESLVIKMNFGNSITLHMILDGLIQILAYPSFQSKELKLIATIVNYIQCGHFKESKQQQEVETKKLELSSIDMDKNLSNAYDFCVFLESKQPFEFTPIIHDHERFFWTRNQLVLRGFLHSEELDYNQWKIVLLNIIDISKQSEELRSSLIMPLLFRMSESSDPKIKISILQNIIQLGASSEIFCTIKALSNGMLRSMAIDLYLKFWKIEPRSYPFLHKLLVEKSEHDSNDQHLNIIRAAAIKEICDLKPYHGSELVSLISEILNQSLESKDCEIPAALAIDSTALLCQNHIISITSTWKALSLTTRYEKRPRVIKSLCKFFSIVPQFKRNSLEFENFMKEIVDRLFHMIQWSDVHGIQCALDALKSWKYDEFTLDMIPEMYRENIVMPQASAGMEVSILDLEVPGECFLQLLTKVHPSALESAGELLSHFIRQEISEYRSGNYLVKEGQAEPINYKNLPKQSIVKTLVHFIIQQATTKKVEKIANDLVIIEVLHILSQKYPRPLPPLNWCFLHELIHKSLKIKEKCIKLAAKQAVISGTAKRLIDNFLINISESDHENIEIAFNLLPDLCNGASNEILKLFYEKIHTCTDENANEKMFNLLNHEKDVTNRENLALITSIFINRNSSDISTKLISAIPSNILNMIHLSSAAQKIQYRCEILKENCHVDSSISISWINELIVDQLLKNECREFLMSSISQLFINTKSFPKKKWLNEFIILIQNKMVEKDFSSDDDLNYLLDLFIITIICVSGYFMIMRKNGIDVFMSRYQLFAQSLEMLSNQQSYSEIIGSIFEFLYFVISHKTLSSPDIKMIFMKAIKLSKSHMYFKKSSSWQKILQAALIS